MGAVRDDAANSSPVKKAASKQKSARGKPVARFIMTVRRAVSLLLGHGHHNASRYPVARIFTEAELVRERLDADAVRDAVLLQMAVGSLLDKSTAQDFSKRVKEMIGGD